jgi:tetratricopeptide (TPR) repeat protein
MKYSRCDRRLILLACLLVAIAALPAAAASEARITPLEIVRKLSAAASAQNQVSLEMFIDAALLFSGVREEELPALRTEIFDLTAAARRELGGITEQEQLAEEILLYLHRHVLLAYRERQTRLDVLIREGSFNCVSSAVLYAVLAKAFSLPVAGVRTPDHAFCRVTAGERAIDVETTSPFGFDPGSRREFKDHFGTVTGYTYVPPQNAADRRLTGESGLLALILYNRSAFASESGDYVQALAPAVDAYSLLGDAESRERLLVAVSNLASYYGLKRRYAEGTSFLRDAVERFGPAPALDRLQADLVYNWAIELIDGGDIPGGLSLLERARATGELEEASWRRLFVYAYQKQALAASRQNYGQAAEIILEAIQQVGREGELLRSFEVYAHNQASGLIAADDYPAARRVLLEALRVIPDSRLLAGDIRKLDTFTGRP